MNLLVHIDTATDARGAFAAGVIVTDTDSARTVHEAGYLIDAEAPHAAAFASLDRALDVIAAMAPERIDLRSTSLRVVNQLTGVEPIDNPTVEGIYESAMGRLLTVDSWQISHGRDAGSRAAALASAALARGADVVELDRDTAATRQKREHTGVPQWTVELLEEPGIDCPARCHMGVRYAFGPDLPGGFCVHAAAVALADGPLRWTDREQTRMTTICPLCDVPIQIEVVA